MKRTAAARGVVLLALAWACPAAAEEPTNAAREVSVREEAARRFDRAAALYADGEFAAALVEFERVYDISHNYRVLYNVGQVAQQLNRYARAHAAFRRYLEEGGDALSADRRAEVTAKLAALSQKVARVTVQAPLKADIYVDDAEVGAAPLEDAILLDPGQHRIAAHLAGATPATRTLNVAAGDTTTVQLSPVSLSDQLRMALPTTRTGSTSTTAIVGWSATAAIAAAATFTGFSALSAASELDRLHASTTTRADLESAHARLNTYSIATDVLIGVGIAAAGASLYFSLRRPPSRAPAGVAPHLRTSGLGAMLGGTF